MEQNKIHWRTLAQVLVFELILQQTNIDEARKAFQRRVDELIGDDPILNMKDANDMLYKIANLSGEEHDTYFVAYEVLSRWRKTMKVLRNAEHDLLAEAAVFVHLAKDEAGEVWALETPSGE